ncbi:hypothetical protein [Actinoplanes siamensis]|uniref:hypothetical protein n=1 Tax=Actinoplanes siamensis TaxID=1223317 RepID=UPI0036204B97
MERPAVSRAGRTGHLAGTVLALGTVSLITDVSSEMVSAILPLYLVAGLGLSPAVYGLIDGLYTGATAAAGASPRCRRWTPRRATGSCSAARPPRGTGGSAP